MHQRLLRCAWAAALCLAAACADTSADRSSDTGANPRGFVTAAGDTLRQRGVWSDSGTAESEFAALYVNRALVAIDEQMHFTDGMRSTRRYRYDGVQQLRQISEERSLTAASGNSTPTLLRSHVEVYFTGDRVDSSRKVVDAVPTTLQPYDIDNFRRHERIIAARVPTTYTAP
jgi:hypothetical protein